MASRPTQRNTRRIYARPGTEPSGPAIAIAPRGPGSAAARLLPVAAAVAVSPRAVRAISPRGQNAPRIACARVRTASSSAPSSQPAA